MLPARRVIERAFGWLKGRWVFCKRNVFWNDLQFTRAAIRACCGLHNYLEEKGAEMPEGEGQDDVVLIPAEELEAEQGIGQDVRNTLVAWVGEH
jgi:hypothetical protein